MVTLVCSLGVKVAVEVGKLADKAAAAAAVGGGAAAVEEESNSPWAGKRSCSVGMM